MNRTLAYYSALSNITDKYYQLLIDNFTEYRTKLNIMMNDYNTERKMYFITVCGSTGIYNKEIGRIISDRLKMIDNLVVLTPEYDLYDNWTMEPNFSKDDLIKFKMIHVTKMLMSDFVIGIPKITLDGFEFGEDTLKDIKTAKEYGLKPVLCSLEEEADNYVFKIVELLLKEKLGVL